MKATLLLCAALSAVAAKAWADDYRPVRCEGPRPYAGKALHPSPDPRDLRVEGAMDGGLTPGETARLDAAFALAARATRAHGLTAAVAVPGRGSWTAQTGDDHPLYAWASAGKQATAVVVLQLAQEGRISLADPVSRWVKGVPNGDAITVEHLLSHTSGLFSANEDKVVHDQGRRLDLAGELAVVRRHGAMFCPGETWRYSNTGYSLLGAIVEQVEGRPLAEAIERRIIQPLGLTHMRAVGPGASVSDVAPPVPDDAQRPLDITAPGPAGPLVASAMDMIRFEQALLDGRLLKPETRALMLRRLYPMFGGDTYYGLGVMLYDVPDTPERLYWIGHSGGAPGVKAVVAYAPRRGAFVAVALTGDGDAHAAANLLLKALADPVSR